MGEKRNFAALDWVMSEISETLKEARQSLEAYVEDPKDSMRIRFCLTHIHQVHGSLEMAEFHGAALLAEEMEHTAQAIMDNSVSNLAEAEEVLMRSLLQLPIFLEHIRSSKEDNPARALPLLNDLRAVRKQSYLSETKLFSPDLTPAKTLTGNKHPVLQDAAKVSQVLGKLREMYQFAAASVLRGLKVNENLTYIEKVFTRLQVLSQGTQSYPMWEAADAFVEGLKSNHIEISVGVKGLLRYLARELRIISENAPKSFATPPRESLLKNILYYVAIAEDGCDKITRLKKKYKLHEALSGSAGGKSPESLLHQPDASAIRSVVVALQEDLANIKHTLDMSLVGQDSTSELKEVLPGVKRVADTLAVLGIGNLRKLMLEQGERLEKISEENTADDAELMDIAGKIIDVEHRLSAISKSAGKHIDLDTIDEREVEIDNAKATVIRECVLGLSRAKEDISEYWSNKWDKHYLENIDTLIAEIRGGLNMIPLNRAAAIVSSCGRFIQEKLVESNENPSGEVLDDLADAIESVKYYLDLLLQDLHDESDSRLDIAEESVNKLGYPIELPLAPAEVPPTISEVAIQDVPVDPALTQQVSGESAVSEHSELSSEQGSEQNVDHSTKPRSSGEASDITEVPMRAEPSTAPETQPVSVEFPQAEETSTSAEPIAAEVEEEIESDIDDEIIEIFIEEAGEVLETLGEYFPQWKENEGNQDALVVVRRAFHTLKGSGRMVEAFDIGELAWSIENMLNRVIDRSIKVTPHVFNIIDAVMALSPTLISAFESRKANPEKALTARYEGWAHQIAEGELPDTLADPIPLYGEPGYTLDTTSGSAPAEETQASDETIEMKVPVFSEEPPLLTETADDIPVLDSVADHESDAPEVSPTEPHDTGLVDTPSLLEQPVEENDLQISFEGSDDSDSHITFEEASAADETTIDDFTQANEEQGDTQHTGYGTDAPLIQDVPLTDKETEDSLAAEADEDISFSTGEIRFEEPDETLISETGFDFSEPMVEDESEPSTLAALTADNDEDTDQVLREIFSQESITHVGTLESFIEGQRADAPAYSVPTDALQRALHTLKGSAKMAQVWPIAEITEPLELLTKELITFQVNVDLDILQLLQDAADYTRVGIEQINAGEKVSIPKIDQFVARTKELRDIAVGHLAVSRFGEARHLDKVDPRMLSLVMAEEIALLLEVDSLLRRTKEDGEFGAEMDNLLKELSVLEEGAQKANLPDMARLSASLRRVHEQAIAQTPPVTDTYFSLVSKGHDTLLDMVDAVAAGQNVPPVSGDLIQSLEALSGAGAAIDGDMVTLEPETPDLAETQEMPSISFELLGEEPQETALEFEHLEPEPEETTLSELEPVDVMPEGTTEITFESFDEPLQDEPLEDGEELQDEAPIELVEESNVDPASAEIQTDLSEPVFELSMEDETDDNFHEPLEDGAEEITFDNDPNALGKITFDAEPFETFDDLDKDEGEDEAIVEISGLTQDDDAPTEQETVDESLISVGAEDDDIELTFTAPNDDDDEGAIEFEVPDALMDEDDSLAQFNDQGTDFEAESSEVSFEFDLEDEDSEGAVDASKDLIEEPSIVEASIPDASNAGKVGVIPGLIDKIDSADEDFDRDILEVFLEEADELVEGMDEAIHAWESDWTDAESLEEIKRILHTVKGGARLSGLSNLGQVFHDYETMLIDMGEDLSSVDEKFFVNVHGYQDRILTAVKGVKKYMDEGYDVGLIGDIAESAEPESVSPDTTESPVAEVEITEAETAENDEPLDFDTIIGAEPEPEVDEPEVDAPEEETATNVVKFEPKSREIPPPIIPGGGASPGEFSMPQVGGGGQTAASVAVKKAGPQEYVKVSAELLEELVNLAGETSINRSRLEQYVNDFSFSLDEVDSTLNRLQDQLRRLDRETEAQILFRQEQMEAHDEFDPLEMDRYSHLQQLSRSLTESASDLNDLNTDLGEKLKVTETLLVQQSRINTTLQEGLMRSRMVPFSRLVPRLRRIVRQVASELGKNVSFELDNVEGELDRSVLERMVPPFEHMLRNAVDHGIEMPEDRIEAGKSESGRIVLTLSREGGDVIIRLADDGRGIDLKRVREKAIERELMSPDAELSDFDIMQFILHAGFSTADSVTQISGRGVGMDVVNAEIKQLGGSVTINSSWGKGTEFVIRLPFTLSVNRALMVAIGSDNYAVPLSSIEGIVRVSPFELEHYYANPEAQFEYANENYHVRYLGSLFHRGVKPALDGHVLPLPVLLVRSAEHTMALQVDAVMGSREIVVKSLGAQFSAVPGLSGATVMGDGSVVVILDPHALVRQEIARAALQLEHGDSVLEAPEEEVLSNRIKTVMVVDDSVTVRKVTTRFLEREGFEVITAKDGVDALRVLQDTVPDLMLLDIEMPRMDGFEVAKTVRTTKRWEDLPIIMITSRTGDKHREHAMSLGVNNYLGKPYQEDILLEAIGDILDTVQ